MICRLRFLGIGPGPRPGVVGARTGGAPAVLNCPSRLCFVVGPRAGPAHPPQREVATPGLRLVLASRVPLASSARFTAPLASSPAQVIALCPGLQVQGMLRETKEGEGPSPPAALQGSPELFFL